MKRVSCWCCNCVKPSFPTATDKAVCDSLNKEVNGRQVSSDKNTRPPVWCPYEKED